MAYTKKQWVDHVVDGDKVIQQGTPLSAGNFNRMEDGIAAAHAELDQSARQVQTLRHGVQVLNGKVGAPVNVQIEGRTLVPMQNTVLDPLKNYVQAGRRTSLKWADGSVTAGVAKFTAKAERPALIRYANLEGKVAGSKVENPHIFATSGSVELMAVTGGVERGEFVYAGITVSHLDGKSVTTASTTAGTTAQHRFSFDLVAEVERTLGRIPKNTVAEKIQWLKDNLSIVRCHWTGFGTSPGGNKATIQTWHPGENAWRLPVSHTAATPSKIGGYSLVGFAPYIDSNGFVHFVVNADPADGTNASTIYSDYVELEIELKPSAILHDPRVPLYEVPAEDYAKILVDWNAEEVAARYPSVEGVKHLRNPYMMAEGENLIDLYEELAKIAPQNVTLLAGNEMLIKNAALFLGKIVGSFAPNTQYTMIYEIQHTPSISQGFLLVFEYTDGTRSPHIYGNGKHTVVSAAGKSVRGLYLTMGTSATDTVIKDFMVTAGTEAKPFVPRNPSYLFAEAVLGEVGGVKDRLVEQDGKYVIRKAVEKDVVVDGSLNWINGPSYPTAKRFYTENVYPVTKAYTTDVTCTKYDGKLMKPQLHNQSADADTLYFASQLSLYVNVSNGDSGFTDAMIPTAAMMKGYFNGWKYTGDGTTHSWVSIVDGTTVPAEQTAAFVAANKAPNYTPYKLSYVLATPQTVDAKVEGAISVNGLTQVEVGTGLIVREKATVDKQALAYVVNSVLAPLKQPAAILMAIYKNNEKDSAWATLKRTAADPKTGLYYYSAPLDAVDPAAEYTVTYLVLDRQKFTTNAVNVRAEYANNVRSALAAVAKRAEDNATQITVQANLMYDVLKRLKAGGL